MNHYTTEQWRPVVGFEGYYEVSDHGRVRGVAREVRHWRGGTLRKPGRLRALTTDNWGYRRVSLSREGHTTIHFVHVLVAAAFIGPKPEGYQVCHGDSDPANNVVSNLRYDTPTGNGADRIAVGRSPRGTKNRTNKLTEAEVREIRAAHAGGASQAALGKRYGVGHTAISKIVHRVNWAWLD